MPLSLTIARRDDILIGKYLLIYEHRYVPDAQNNCYRAMFVLSNPDLPHGRHLKHEYVPEGDCWEVFPGAHLTVRDCRKQGKTRIAIDAPGFEVRHRTRSEWLSRSGPQKS